MQTSQKPLVIGGKVIHLKVWNGNLLFQGRVGNENFIVRCYELLFVVIEFC